jgi:glyoxylase-like metal-dependent hydrolase (beta-lactamase superfamily II)
VTTPVGRLARRRNTAGARSVARFAPVRLDACNPGPLTGHGNNTYLLVGSGVGTLVDAGIGEPDHLRAITEKLARRHARLTQVLVTHGHSDHVGGVGAIAAAHPGVRFRKHPWPAADARWPVPFDALTDGDLIDLGGGQMLKTVHTPGHSPDHLAFFHEKSRTVFTGDLVVPGGSVMLHWSGGGNLGEYLKSLERVLALRAKRLLPAHGAAVTEPSAVLQGHLDHRLMRERQVIEAVTAGLATVQAIADSIYYGLEPALMAAARENVRAHLEKLKTDGRVVEKDAKWIIRWTR